MKCAISLLLLCVAATSRVGADPGADLAWERLSNDSSFDTAVTDVLTASDADKLNTLQDQILQQHYIKRYLEYRERWLFETRPAAPTIEGVLRLQEDLATSRFSAAAHRMHIQTGGAGAGVGATSLAARTSATDFISAAIESGAVSSKTDQGVARFTLNALSATQLATGQGAPYGCRSPVYKDSSKLNCMEGAGRWIRGLSGFVAFNIDGKETAIPGLAMEGENTVLTDGFAVLRNPRTLSNVGFKYEFFVRERDQEELQKAVNVAVDNLKKDAEPFLQDWADLDRSDIGAMTDSWWEANEQTLLDKLDSREQFLTAFRVALEELWNQVAESSEHRDQLLESGKSSMQLASAISQQLADRTFRNALSFDYIHQRPTDQPQLNKFRLDFNLPLGKRHEPGDPTAINTRGAAGSVDFNVAVTTYHNSQMIDDKMKRLRDANASLALNWRLRPWGELGSPIVTVAGYYQYMFEDALIEFNSEAFTPDSSRIPLSGPAMKVLDTKGSIGLGQVRFEIPLGADSGITMPIAVSYGNRTELINTPQKSFFQGQVGLHYDLKNLQEKLRRR